MKEELEVDFIEKLCIVAGVPFPDTYKRLKGVWKNVWFGYMMLTHFLMMLLWLSVIIQLILYGKDLEGSIMNVIFLAQINFKIIYLFYKNDNFTNIFNRLVNLSYELHEKDDKYMAIHRKHLRWLRKYAKFKTWFEIASASSYAMGAVLISFFADPGTVVMPIRIWVPNGFRVNPYFSFLILFQCGMILMALLKTSITDLIFLMFLSLSSAIFTYLKEVMNEMFESETSYKVVSGNAVARSRRDYLKFLWWVKKHQAITGVLVDAKPLFSACLCASYVYIMMNLFLGGVIFTSSDSEWDFPKKFLVLLNMVNNAFQLYLQCFAMDILAECGQEVADLTDSRLITTSKELSRTYLIALSRALKPIKFTSAGINPLSSQTFGSMLKAMVSYFVTVLQIRERRKTVA